MQIRVKKCALVCAFIICAIPVFAGPLPEVLTVSILNWDGTPAAGGLQFPGTGSVTTANPWIRSPQYLRVTYISDETIWGIRIVTNNEVDIGHVYPKPLNQGPDGLWHWISLGLTAYQYAGGAWQTGDDSVSFNGLIDPATKSNPNFRAELAWQVFANPVSVPDPVYRDWSGRWNVGGEWNDNWAYVIDKNNRWNGVVSVGGVYYSPGPPTSYDAKYEMVVTGDPFVSNLAQHPVVSGSGDPKPGDGDIAVYLAACFGIPNESGGFSSILPAGSYGGRIYLELFHE